MDAFNFIDSWGAIKQHNDLIMLILALDFLTLRCLPSSQRIALHLISVLSLFSLFSTIFAFDSRPSSLAGHIWSHVSSQCVAFTLLYFSWFCSSILQQMCWCVCVLCTFVSNICVRACVRVPSLSYILILIAMSPPAFCSHSHCYLLHSHSNSSFRSFVLRLSFLVSLALSLSSNIIIFRKCPIEA